MRWTLKEAPDENSSITLSAQLGVSQVVSDLLLQRGVDTFDKAKTFFRPSLDELHDPFLMKDMDKAVSRILQAIDTNERILVYGDYDVDGTTSVALMSSYLKTHMPFVDTYIPDRYDEGYGVSYKGIDYAADNEMNLIIALDCGIKAIEKIHYAKEKGIDFIICDHHRPGDKIPDAVAVLDPKRGDCAYPYKELCGCGVGFKLISAISITRKENFETLHSYLDLVATAIGADIVPITGENRILAYHGLQVINSAPRAGFKAIIEHTKKHSLTITDVVFIIAPRINAAGRMKHGDYAVSLLIQNEYTTACQYALEIEQYNKDRKTVEEQITQEAVQQLIDNKEEVRFTSVVLGTSWHKGVIGIVASRLIEKYYRPTLIFTKNGDRLAASARSVRGFDVYNALEACSEYIEQFGGHKYAAGLTILPDNYEQFKAKFEEVVSITIKPEHLTPELNIDTEINFSDITPKFYRIISQFAPFGPGNMRPQFLSRNIKDTGYAKAVGNPANHLKAKLEPQEDKTSNSFDVIGFNLAAKLDLLKDKNQVDIVYNIEENTWNDKTTIQLRLKDIAVH